MSGLAINGDTVHGLAVAGQAFLPENQAGIPTNLSQSNFHMFAFSYDFSSTTATVEGDISQFLGHTIMAMLFDIDEGKIDGSDTNFGITKPFVFKNGVSMQDMLNTNKAIFKFYSNGIINTPQYTYQCPRLCIVDFSNNT